MVDTAMRRIIDHIESLPDQPAGPTRPPAEAARAVRGPIPEEGRDLGSLLDVVFDEAAPQSFNSAGPGYLAYIPGGGLFHSAVADLVADAINRYTGVWQAAPALVQLEADALDWMCTMVGYDVGGTPRPGGILTSGGSIANLVAIVTARRARLPEDFLSGVLYASDQTHHSVAKAAVLAGFPARNVRSVPTDDRFRMDLDALRGMVAEDRAAGRTPFFVVGNAGTTNTGAVDDLVGIGRFTREQGLWYHVDAAYGGFFLLTERGQERLAGTETADSVTLDPHKGLFLPFGTGALVVKDRDDLVRAHSVDADYLPAQPADGEFADFSTMSPELSRPYRGLGVWLPLQALGVSTFRTALDEKLDLAQVVYDGIQKLPHIEVLAAPQLSVTAFRLRPPGRDDDALDRLNERFLAAVNRRQRVHLSGTRLHGRFALRVCILTHRTHLERVEMCLEDLRAAADEVLSSEPANRS